MAKRDSNDESVPARVAEVYSEMDEVRALVQLIPILGGPIDTLIAGRGAKLMRQRIEALVDDVRAHAERLEKEKVDHAFIESEEFDDLVMRAFRAASATRDREKIRMYAAILVGAASTDRPEGLESEAALAAIAELSPTEVALARVIYNNLLGHYNGKGTWDRRYEWMPKEFITDMDFHLKRIERTGLILQVASSGPVGPTSEYYVVTPTFQRIMAYLEPKTTNGGGQSP